MKKITFLPRHIASQWVNSNNAILISIYDKEDGPLPMTSNWNDVCSVQFDDIDENAKDESLIVFSSAQAQQLLEFVRRHADSVSPCEELVVHCGLVQSRSAAVALFFSEVYEVPCFKEQLKVDALSYRLYNKKVYSTLHAALYGTPGEAFLAEPVLTT